MQSLRRRCPLNQAGGAERTRQPSGIVWKTGSQLMKETLPRTPSQDMVSLTYYWECLAFSYGFDLQRLESRICGVSLNWILARRFN